MLGPDSAPYHFMVYSNHAVGAAMPAIKQALIIPPGFRRDGDVYFASATRLAERSGARHAETLLLTPQFFATPDAAKTELSGMPVWTVGGWLAGQDAIAGPYPISSLSVMDDLLTWLSDRRRFPALERVVIAGNSAGAQLVQRYAALNRIDETVRNRGIDLQYIVSAPGSYLYFTDERSQGNEFLPYDNPACPDFNDYKYGFRRIVRYAARSDPVEAWARYASRNVTYLVGSADSNPDSRVLDKSCAAAAQGRHRAERARIYVRYLRHLAGGRGNLSHRAFEVVDTGHDHERVLGSVCGLQALFNTPALPLAGEAKCMEIAD